MAIFIILFSLSWTENLSYGGQTAEWAFAHTIWMGPNVRVDGFFFLYWIMAFPAQTALGIQPIYISHGLQYVVYIFNYSYIYIIYFPLPLLITYSILYTQILSHSRIPYPFWLWKVLHMGMIKKGRPTSILPWNAIKKPIDKHVDGRHLNKWWIRRERKKKK